MPKKKKKGKKGKKGAPVVKPPPPPPPRVPVWPHGAVPDWQRLEGDVAAAAPEWKRLPVVVSAPPADAKLCYDRFRQGPPKVGPDLTEDISSLTSELSGRMELRGVVESAYKSIAALNTGSVKERLGRENHSTAGTASELRARLGALVAASALVRIAHSEGVSDNKIRDARVGDVDGDGVDTETLEMLTTLIVDERESRQAAAVEAAERAAEVKVAAAGSASFLLSSASPTIPSPSAQGQPRKLKPIRRRPSPSRYTFQDSLDVSYAPSKGRWTTPKHLKDGSKYIQEGGHQPKRLDDSGNSMLETGNSSSFSYQRATTAHGISRSVSCPPTIARGTMSGHGNLSGGNWLAADDLLNSAAALEVTAAEQRDRRYRCEARVQSPEFVRTFRIKQLQRSGYMRGTDVSTGKATWYKKGTDGRVRTCEPATDLLLPTNLDAAVFSPPTSPMKVQECNSVDPAPQTTLRRLGQVNCGLTEGSEKWLVGQATSNMSFSFTHKLKSGEERVYRPTY